MEKLNMDWDIYRTEMAKSVWDKAFFMDKIPGAKCVIDFGCADGAMIRFLSSIYSDITFIGYDMNRDLINFASAVSPSNANLSYYCGEWEEFDSMINFVLEHFGEDEICINFSSVLHEVYSSTGGIETIKTLIGKLEPRYITIRDMYCDDPVPFSGSHDEWGLIDIIRRDDEQYIRATEFNKKFGTLNHWRDMVHLLMKLQWINNGWAQELKENYFSWTIDQFLRDICNNYIISFEAHYQLPYLGEKWKKEYGWYNPDIYTHAQFILRRDD